MELITKAGNKSWLLSDSAADELQLGQSGDATIRAPRMSVLHIQKIEGELPFRTEEKLDAPPSPLMSLPLPLAK